MPRTDPAIRLRHMLDAASKAARFAHGRSRADLETDEMLALALERLLKILGEAAKSASADFRQDHPGIPLGWGKRIWTRN